MDNTQYLNRHYRNSFFSFSRNVQSTICSGVVWIVHVQSPVILIARQAFNSLFDFFFPRYICVKWFDEHLLNGYYGNVGDSVWIQDSISLEQYRSVSFVYLFSLSEFPIFGGRAYSKLIRSIGFYLHSFPVIVHSLSCFFSLF